jgi:hypothetical protein
MAVKCFSIAFFILTKSFWSPKKGGQVLWFWKAFDKGFPKTYDMASFSNDPKIWSLFDNSNLFNGDHHLTHPTIKWRLKVFGHHLMV